ncbi:uncharacterized protein LOC126846048 [Adelges cooleyi]|uniref:uncharacterized protein LOC126846048 n=1 Tax=Adelges cooleyi TaxID=133065 RepID=UPI00218026D8|nr:uncharacterized protein LOC126846048 [Adelges cooleyi]
MKFCLDVTIKIIKKILLALVTSFLYCTISESVPTCPTTNVGWKIFPFDEQFNVSSTLFMFSTVIVISKMDLWPCNIKPQNRFVRFTAEVHIKTILVLLLYATFWHPVVMAISVYTDFLAKLTQSWTQSSNILFKNCPVCLENVRSTKFNAIMLSTILLVNILRTQGLT